MQLVQLAVQAVGLGHLQDAARQAQPDQHAFQARQLLGQLARLALVILQRQDADFLVQELAQPAADGRRAGAGAARVALLGPAAREQPVRQLQREQAPAGVVQLGGELLRRGLAGRFVELSGRQARAPVGQQRIQRLAQRVAADPRCGLAEAAEQGAQVDQLLQPLLQQFPVAGEAVLLGQPLAAAQQVPGQRREHLVQRLFGVQRRRRQAQAVAAGVEQPVAALGLADVAGHQRQVGRQADGQLQQHLGTALAQLQLQLADLFLATVGQHLAQVQGGLDQHLVLTLAPADVGLLAHEIGGEQRLQAGLVQLGQAGRPAIVAEQRRVQLGALQVPVPLVAFGQPGHALTAALQGLDELLAVAAQAQRDPCVSQIPTGGVVILVVQLDAPPATAIAPGQQRMVAQRRQGGAAGAQFDFGFFVHGGVSRKWRALYGQHGRQASHA